MKQPSFVENVPHLYVLRELLKIELHRHEAVSSDQFYTNSFLVELHDVWFEYLNDNFGSPCNGRALKRIAKTI